MSETNQPTIEGADAVKDGEAYVDPLTGQAVPDAPSPRPASASVAGMGTRAKKASATKRSAVPKRKAEARLVEENDGTLLIELWVTGRRTTLDIDEAEILGGNLIARASTAKRISRERDDEDF